MGFNSGFKGLTVARIARLLSTVPLVELEYKLQDIYFNTKINDLFI